MGLRTLARVLVVSMFLLLLIFNRKLFRARRVASGTEGILLKVAKIVKLIIELTKSKFFSEGVFLYGGFSLLQSEPGVNISTEKRKLFPDNLLKTRNFSQGNCDLLKGTSINEVTFGVFLNPFPSPPL